ncbi:hypothetical protein BUALT_Bualt01G0075600 [Buddleja alternifolia]|uniref:WRKY19-like zinc finger domain-containing protein n=1 Tax=Buddleja alternifolia TaxID=168488 RepID=A0AAV6YDS2_9LAMI|nr:hypothetical protein BUALT_Bualt01G0075600 [Buddleja alternifolia]
MDGTPGYTTTMAFRSKDLEKDHTVVSTLDFDSPRVSSSCFPKGSKRKCSTADRHINLKDGCSLVLGLGHSSSSCTTICSGKEMEDNSSVDFVLHINPHTGGNRSYNPKKASVGTLVANRPILDLQLSLSTAPAESDVTTVTPSLIPYHNYPESPALAPSVQFVDEGSTSSRWKSGPLLPPSQNIEISIPFDQDRALENANPLSPKISSTPRKTSAKICRFQGCTRGARGASGLCISHGGGRRCQRAGCHKGAEGKTVFCKAHGGGRRCHHLGCTKSAEGRTDYCIAHGGGRRCSHEDCSRAARGKSGLCIRHGGGKRCGVENCTKSAEGISGLCISHGGGRRCQYPECTKGAQGSTMFCKAHGGGRRCVFLGCTKGAEGSTLFCKGHGGGKRCTSEGCTKSVHGGTLFCVSHGGGKRCAAPECTKSARGRTNYCVRHGGGKRCKLEGCTKSAQGSTDFCKAHGGGKRCCWGESGVEFGCPGGFIPCDKFARGKHGLCAFHSAQVQEKLTHESFEMVSTTRGPESCTSTVMKGTFVSGNSHLYPGTSKKCGTTSVGSMGHGNFVIGNSYLDHLTLPEGRVHGGGLMAMLRGDKMFVTNNAGEEGNDQLELGKSYHMPHSWV